MSHEWDRGVLNASSWHKLETIADMATAEDLIGHGLSSGAWPTGVRRAHLTAEGIDVPRLIGEAIVGDYQAHPSRAIGLVGGRYVATTPAEWQDTCKAAVQAGARPTGAFSLSNGSKVLATFEIDRNGTSTQLLLLDSFDGTTKLQCGFTVVRVVCANTLAMALRQNGNAQALVRHTASLPDRVQALQAAIGDAIASGREVRDMYQATEGLRLNRDDAESVFDRLWPRAPEGSTKHAISKADNTRTDAREAMARKENNVGPTLGTLWNAATWLVDREPSGATKPCRGGANPLESLILGSRSQRVQEVQTIIELVMRDGTIRSVPAREALELAPSAAPSIGAKVLEDMIS